jgi:hypothetical protein
MRNNKVKMPLIDAVMVVDQSSAATELAMSRSTSLFCRWNNVLVALFEFARFASSSLSQNQRYFKNYWIPSFAFCSL